MIRRLLVSAGVVSAVLLALAGPPGDGLDEPAAAMALTGVVATVASTSAETSATPSTSEPVVTSIGVDEAASSRTGTVAFIVSIVAVLAIGGFVVFRSRQIRAENARHDS